MCRGGRRRKKEREGEREVECVGVGAAVHDYVAVVTAVRVRGPQCGETPSSLTPGVPGTKHPLPSRQRHNHRPQGLPCVSRRLHGEGKWNST